MRQHSVADAFTHACCRERAIKQVRETMASVDNATAEALRQDKGLTTEALRRDRGLQPSAAAAAPAEPPRVQQFEIEAPESGLARVPTGFDPYLINGRGPNDERDEITGIHNPECCGVQCLCIPNCCRCACSIQ